MQDILDLLLESSLIQHNKAKKRHPVAEVQEKQPQISTYQNPDNWKTTHTVALIHRATDGEETLLGNFQEYLHKFGARKLCRVVEPIPCECSEYVTGDYWLHPYQEHIHDRNTGHWLHEHSLIIGVTLKELLLHNPEVSVTVTTFAGSVAKVHLFAETRFFSADRNFFLMLHAGTEILGCMGFDSKVDLKNQLDRKKEDEEEEEGL